jgi:hypothetical protein
MKPKISKSKNNKRKTQKKKKTFDMDACVEGGFIRWSCPRCNYRNVHIYRETDYYFCGECEKTTKINH